MVVLIVLEVVCCFAEFVVCFWLTKSVSFERRSFVRLRVEQSGLRFKRSSWNTKPTNYSSYASLSNKIASWSQPSQIGNSTKPGEPIRREYARQLFVGDHRAAHCSLAQLDSWLDSREGRYEVEVDKLSRDMQ